MSRAPLDNEIDELLRLEDEKVPELIETSKSVTEKYWGKEVQCYYPGRLFPSISITGKECSLKCQHCNHHYLETMIPAETPSKLTEIAMKLSKDGALGCLISGGFTSEAYLPIKEFLPALREIKQKTKLLVNIHTGLVSEDIPRKLASIGIDAVSIDIIGSNETIQSVLGISRVYEDYAINLKLLKAAGVKNVTPHICVGLHHGKLKGEGEALKIIRDNAPEIVTFIAFNPTKGTSMQDVQPPTPRTIAKVIAVARLMLPRTRISLGCMRPVGAIRGEIDYLAILAGANRIVVPSPASLRRLEQEHRFVPHQTCCVM
nr:radical SAM protein [Candidatus Njordarchaeota archaeon]